MVRLPFNFFQWGESGLGTGITPFWSGHWSGVSGGFVRTFGFSQFYTLENLQGVQGNFFLLHDSIFWPTTLEARFSGEIPSYNCDRPTVDLSFRGTMFPFNTVEASITGLVTGDFIGDSVDYGDFYTSYTGLVDGAAADQPTLNFVVSGQVRFSLRDEPNLNFVFTGKFQEPYKDSSTLSGRFTGLIKPLHARDSANIGMIWSGVTFSEGNVEVTVEYEDFYNLGLEFFKIIWSS